MYRYRYVILNSCCAAVSETPLRVLSGLKPKRLQNPTWIVNMSYVDPSTSYVDGSYADQSFVTYAVMRPTRSNPYVGRTDLRGHATYAVEPLRGDNRPTRSCDLRGRAPTWGWVLRGQTYAVISSVTHVVGRRAETICFCACTYEVNIVEAVNAAWTDAVHARLQSAEHRSGRNSIFTFF